MHRLVHMITGQWGDEITATTQGTLITRTYTYEVPVHYNSIFTNVAELEVVAFVTESTQEIVSGNGAMVSVIPSDYDNDLGLFDIAQIQTQCENDVVAKASLMNVGTTDVNSVDINYSINGGTAQTFTWTGTLAVNGFTVVDIPIQGFELEDVNTIELSLANDDNNSNNVKTTTFNKAVETSNSLILNLRTDGYGSECRWNVKNSNGEIVAQGNGYGNNQNLTIPITLEGEDCFTFNLIDSYGDGGAPITLRDHNNVIIYQTNGGYGSGETANFSTDGTMGVEDVNISNVQIYPNPSNGIINIALEKDAKIEVYDVTGRSIYAGNAKAGDNSINLTGKGKGTFVVKITEGANRITKKVIIK